LQRPRFTYREPRGNGELERVYEEWRVVAVKPAVEALA